MAGAAAADRLEVEPDARRRQAPGVAGVAADEDEELDAAFGSGSPGVVTPESGAGSGGLPKGPEPARRVAGLVVGADGLVGQAGVDRSGSGTTGPTARSGCRGPAPCPGRTGSWPGRPGCSGRRPPPPPDWRWSGDGAVVVPDQAGQVAGHLGEVAHDVVEQRVVRRQRRDTVWRLVTRLSMSPEREAMAVNTWSRLPMIWPTWVSSAAPSSRRRRRC